MTTRMIKLLGASTAFVAAAAATSANAAVVSQTSNSLVTVYTSDTTGFNVSGTAAISTTVGSAIEVSNTGSLPINVQTGTVVRNAVAASATIQTVNDAVPGSGLVVNNSGSIINLGANGVAISSSAPLTVRNSGTISGSIVSTAGTDSVDLLSGSSMRGNISLGNGANTVTASNTTLIGGYTGGTGLDTVTLTNTVVSGTLNGGTTGGDADVLTINGQNTFTTHGAISNFENVNFNTSTVLNHGLSGADAVNLAAGKTLWVNNSFATATTGTITNSGTMIIDAGKTVTTGGYSSNGGTLGLVIGSSNTTSGIGKVAFTNATTITAAPSVTISVGANSGFIASGTTYTVVDGAGGVAVAANILNSNTGVYRFSSVAAGNDINITVGRVSTSSVVTGAEGKAIANVLDVLGANASGTLATVQAVIGQQSTAAGVDNVVNSLTPSIDGAGAASVNVSVDTGNQISNRLASLRGTSGVATGDALASKHMWMQAFGSTVDQDNNNGAFGYDANAGGVSIGLDTDTLVDGATTGLAVSYGHGSVDSKSSSNATTDIDTYMATLYGSRVMDNGVFVNGQLSGGMNTYDMERTIIGVGKSTGDTDGFQGSAKVEGGKDFAAGGFTVTPLASLQYTYLDMDSYTETGAGGASLRVNPESMSTLDAGAGVNLAYGIPLSDGGTLKPSAHAKYIYRMGDESLGTTSSFVGGGAAFNTAGVKADRSSVNLGAGLLLTTVGGTDLSLNYDADIRSNLTGHTGQLKARWAF